MNVVNVDKLLWFKGNKRLWGCAVMVVTVWHRPADDYFPTTPCPRVLFPHVLRYTNGYDFEYYPCN